MTPTSYSRPAGSARTSWSEAASPPPAVPLGGSPYRALPAHDRMVISMRKYRVSINFGRKHLVENTRGLHRARMLLLEQIRFASSMATHGDEISFEIMRLGRKQEAVFSGVVARA